MVGDSELPEIEAEGEVPQSPRRKRWRLLATLLGLAALLLVLAWIERRSIAERIIAGQLEQLDLPATYELEQVGATRQVLRNVTIGDPARPDLTVEQVIVEIEPKLGIPTIGKITATGARLYGTYRSGKLSFGSLDKVIFAETGKREGLPDLDLTLVDARARLDTDYGPVGFKADGSGQLQGGFAGVLAATAPRLNLASCLLDSVTLYGAVTIEQGAPGFKGPLRLAALACPKQGLSLRNTAIALEARTDAGFAGVSGKLGLTGGALGWQGAKVAKLGGEGDFTLRAGDLTARYALTGKGLAAGWTDAAALTIDGMVRSHDKFARFEAEGSLEGSDLRPGKAADALLAGAGQGTLVEPLAKAIRAGLAREGRGSRLSALYTWRQTGAIADVVIPRATIRGGSGAEVLALSRFYLTAGGSAGPRLSGNFATGGAGLPRLTGRIERQSGGVTLARFAMPEYRAGDTRVALPELALVQRRGGEIGFSGRALMSGALPGGRVDGLTIPLDGTWSARRGFAAWRGCTALRFDQLVYAQLTLDARQLVLCPGRDGAIVRSDDRSLRFAAGTGALALSGKLGSTPLRLTTGSVGFAVPGRLAARQVDLALGDPAAPNTFKIAELTGQLGKASSGHFAKGEFKLAAVPLDIFDAAGTWSYANGALTLGEAGFRLLDRERDARFRPLIARDASLTLIDGKIVAQALMREPSSDREIVRTTIAHALGNGTGYADLAVPGVVFDGKLQPDTLTALALGVIANAKGTVRGDGRIDWTAERVTSTGKFSTDWLDFAAAFGPVEGTSGSVVFTDLIGLVTAPDQRLKIAAINPGIEVGNGELSFALQGEGVLVVNGAKWPFIDGQLELKPTRMVLGAAEVRRFVLSVEGANAAKFIQQLELSNLAATGTFDGELPLVFDENGGRIVGGHLTSRAPGGNVSYVGDLSYKDLGTMANFAFQALRSIDYRQMRIELDGSLEGEIVSRIRFDGVRQGQGTKQNLITRRLASLPIQFNVNIRAPFQKLMASFRGLYDTDFVRDPRAVGLLDPAGKVLAPPQSSPPVPPIQTPESRETP